MEHTKCVTSVQLVKIFLLLSNSRADPIGDCLIKVSLFLENLETSFSLPLPYPYCNTCINHQFTIPQITFAVGLNEKKMFGE